MWFFRTKKIVSVEIIAQSEGISESDQLTNLVAGHMMIKVNKRKRQYTEIAKPKLLKNSPKLVVELKAILMN